MCEQLGVSPEGKVLRESDDICPSEYYNLSREEKAKLFPGRPDVIARFDRAVETLAKENKLKDNKFKTAWIAGVADSLSPDG